MAPSKPTLVVGQIFTAHEVADLLHLRSVRSVKKLFAAGTLEHFQPSRGEIRVTEAALVNYIARTSAPLIVSRLSTVPRDPLATFVAAQVKAILDEMVREGFVKIVTPNTEGPHG